MEVCTLHRNPLESSGTQLTRYAKTFGMMWNPTSMPPWNYPKPGCTLQKGCTGKFSMMQAMKGKMLSMKRKE
jgi:hypothetical protein